jgi:hypothetical protein
VVIKGDKYLMNIIFHTVIAALFFWGCGVNSGNPKGTPKTTVSLFLQSAPAKGLADLNLRVRGFQLLSGQNLNRPGSSANQDRMVEVLFPDLKVLNAMDYSKNGRISIVENYDLELEEYSQIRLLFDVTHAGITNLPSGQKKIVHVMPMDLYLSAAGQPLPEGGRQSDQMLFNDSFGAIKPNASNNLALYMDLQRTITPPESIADQVRNFYSAEKGLSQVSIGDALFMKPIQSDKRNVYSLDAIGLVRVMAPNIESGQLCLFPSSARDSITSRLANLDRGCEGAAFLLPIRDYRAAASIPKGDYIGVLFATEGSKAVADVRSFNVVDDESIYEIK